MPKQPRCPNGYKRDSKTGICTLKSKVSKKSKTLKKTSTTNKRPELIIKLIAQFEKESKQRYFDNKGRQYIDYYSRPLTTREKKLISNVVNNNPDLDEKQLFKLLNKEVKHVGQGEKKSLLEQTNGHIPSDYVYNPIRPLPEFYERLL